MIVMELGASLAIAGCGIEDHRMQPMPTIIAHVLRFRFRNFCFPSFGPVEAGSNTQGRGNNFPASVLFGQAVDDLNSKIRKLKQICGFNPDSEKNTDLFKEFSPSV